MTKSKIGTKQYEASIAAVRKKGGGEVQSHWESRLKAAMKRPGKPLKTLITR